MHDGAYEWFYDGTAPVARLLRPQRRAYDYSFGIELVLPSFASEGVAIAAAHSLARAIEPYRDASPAATSPPVAGIARETRDGHAGIIETGAVQTR